MHISSIAVGLLAQSLPPGTVGHPVGWRNKKRKKSEISTEPHHHAPVQHHVRSGLDVVRTNVPQVASHMKTAEPADASSRIDLSHNECNPLSNDPDTGILSCGSPDSRCVASKESTLGGLCIEYKKAQAFHRAMLQSVGYVCNGFDGGTFNYDGVMCDCTQFANNVGTYTCVLSDQNCLDDAEQVCFTFSYEVTIAADRSYSVTYCFNFLEGAPVDSVCYGVSYSGGAAALPQCEFTVNNVACSSCSLAMCINDDSGYIVDCTNTALNTAGNTCREFGDFIADSVQALPQDPQAPSVAPIEESALPTFVTEESPMPSTELSEDAVAPSVSPSLEETGMPTIEPSSSPTSEPSTDPIFPPRDPTTQMTSGSATLLPASTFWITTITVAAFWLCFSIG